MQYDRAAVLLILFICIELSIAFFASAHPGHEHEENATTTPASTDEPAVEIVTDEVLAAATTTTEPTKSINPYPVEVLPNQSVFNDFVVGPGKFELELAPGQSRTVELMVTNRMGEPKRFKFEIEDTAGSSDGSSAITLLGQQEGPYTLRDYVQIPEMEFELEHGQKARIPVTVSLPLNAEPGGRYGSVVVSTVSRDAELNPEGNALPSSAIVSRIGTLFFVTTPGDVEREGKLAAFSTKGSKLFYNQGPVDFTIAYENTGSVHVNPYGELRIRNMFGDEVGYVQLDPWFAMPASLRTREFSWNRELLIGRYTATLQLNRGYDDIVDEASVSFFIVPWKLIAVVFGALFIIIFSIRLVFSRFEFKRK